MKNKQEEKGFIQFLVIIVIAVIILLYAGLDPLNIWTGTVLPILSSVAKIFVAIVDFLVRITVSLFGVFN